MFTKQTLNPTIRLMKETKFVWNENVNKISKTTRNARAC